MVERALAADDTSRGDSPIRCNFIILLTNMAAAVEKHVQSERNGPMRMGDRTGGGHIHTYCIRMRKKKDAKQ